MTPLGQIKLRLMETGIRPDATAKRVLEEAGGIAGAANFVLLLTGDLIVPVQVAPETPEAPCLVEKQGKLILELAEGPQEAGFSTLPPFLKDLKKKGGANAAQVALDGYCLNLFLKVSGNSPNMQEQEIMNCLHGVFSEQAAELVQLNLDYCDQPDRGLAKVLPLISSIKHNFRTFIALRGFAPDDHKLLDHLYAAGVDVLTLPLEGFSSAARLDEIMASEHTHRALEYAASVFPHGSIQTELICPVEPMELLLNKIDLLTQKKVLPVLKLPMGGVALEHFPYIAEAVQHLDGAVLRNRIPLKWLYPAALNISPLDASFYLRPPGEARLAMRPIYKSTFGKTASEGFAALRRALRVKNISDSYESAGL